MLLRVDIDQKQRSKDVWVLTSTGSATWSTACASDKSPDRYSIMNSKGRMIDGRGSYLFLFRSGGNEK